MTRFLLIRHGAHDFGGERIAGQTMGVQLSPLGRQQSIALVGRVKHLPIRAIYSSPYERTRESAAPLAEHLKLHVQVLDTLGEVKFGDWSGQRLEHLRADERFRCWNEFRSGVCPPGGEYAIETQARIAGEMLRLSALHGDEVVALFSHGDVIKAAVAYFLGVPIDLYRRIEISLASVTVIAIGAYGPWVLCINNRERIEIEE